MKNNKTYDLNAVIITKRAHTSSAITIFIITVILLLWPFIASCTTMKNYYSDLFEIFKNVTESNIKISEKFTKFSR